MKRSRRTVPHVTHTVTIPDTRRPAPPTSTLHTRPAPAAPVTPPHPGPFSPHRVERLTETILAEKLQGVEYNPTVCKRLSQDLAAAIMEALKALDSDRKLDRKYKLVAMVSLGSVRERPAVTFGSRCFWDTDSDGYATVKFANGSLYAVVIVYGMLVQ